MSRGALALAVAIAGAFLGGTNAAAAVSVIGASRSVSVNLDLAAIILAIGTAAAGVAAWRRLRLDRPKIVEEVAALHEGRLRDALDAAWEEADRLRELAKGYADELSGCHSRIAELERREDELEGQIAALAADLARYRGGA